MKDSIKYIIVFILGALFIILCSWTRTVDVGRTVSVDKYSIDGQYYIIATTANGVAICPAK